MAIFVNLPINMNKTIFRPNMKKTFLFLLACVLTIMAKADVEDVLDQSVTGISGNNYKDFTDKTATSNAVYAGCCAGSSNTIQLRTTNKKEGIVSTASGGNLKQVVIEWNKDLTTKGRTVQIYLSKNPYTSASELFGNSKPKYEVTYDATNPSNTITIEGDYTYIGIRSKDGTAYLNSIAITWDGEPRTDDPDPRPEPGDDPFPRGDVNRGGNVDISDVTTLVNIILGKE